MATRGRLSPQRGYCAATRGRLSPQRGYCAATRGRLTAQRTLAATPLDKLATNVQGQYLGAPELDTLFSFLNERRAVVILHPHRPEPVNRQVMQQTPLAMQEYLSETTRAVSNMISRNVLARYPNVKVVVPPVPHRVSGRCKGDSAREPEVGAWCTLPVPLTTESTW